MAKYSIIKYYFYSYYSHAIIFEGHKDRAENTLWHDRLTPSGTLHSVANGGDGA